MNTVCMVIDVVFLIFVIAGWKKGFFRVLISVVGLVASIAVSMFAAPYVSSYLQANTLLDEKIAETVSEKLQLSEAGKEASKGVQVALIETLPLPDVMKESILNNNNSETYDILQATGAYDYIAKSVAVVIINTGVFMLLTLACRIFFLFIGKVVKGITKLPIVRWMDKAGGGILGAVRGLLLIWIFFLILSMTSSMQWSSSIIKSLQQSQMHMLLYEHNPILDVVGNISKILFH